MLLMLKKIQQDSPIVYATYYKHKILIIEIIRQRTSGATATLSPIEMLKSVFFYYD
jgi:hypothetical protein